MQEGQEKEPEIRCTIFLAPSGEDTFKLVRSHSPYIPDEWVRRGTRRVQKRLRALPMRRHDDTSNSDKERDPDGWRVEKGGHERMKRRWGSAKFRAALSMRLGPEQCANDIGIVGLAFEPEARGLHAHLMTWANQKELR